jgi:ectoine hydroxylase-related dioxygenase (phytanoyl-CoA dioxygenase family)
VEQLFDAQEIELLAEITHRVLALPDPHQLDRHDHAGNVTRLSLRNEPGDDVFSATVRCARIAETMTTLLGGEIYHYHHKVMIKDPEVGGAWEWHQDYGYWYANGILSADMASCMIALTPHTRENGCLQVVRGSHLLGRIDHTLTGDQVGADAERVEHILERLPVVHCELAPGTGLFFHSNLLHRSEQNRSKEMRLSLIDCYNAARNEAYEAHHHQAYEPLEILDDSAVRIAGQAQLNALRAEA